MKHLKIFLTILLAISLLIPLAVTPALADTVTTERLQWDSVSYVYFEDDSNGKIKLGEGATFGNTRDIVYYTVEHNPKWENKKVKNIKRVNVESINDINKLSSHRHQFYAKYNGFKGGLSNTSIIKQEVRNGNSIYLKTNLAVNPPVLNGEISTADIIDITTKSNFDKFRSLGADIPDNMENRRQELAKAGKRLYVMPMFLLFTVEIEVEPEVEPTEKVTSLPDMYVKDIKTTVKETEGGKVYNSTVTYGMKGPFEGKVTAKLGLTHNGYGVSKIDSQKAEFSAWQEKTFNFTFTGQKGKDSVLEAKIWPVSPTSEDSNWSNNNKKLVVPQKANIDLSVNFWDWTNRVRSGKSRVMQASIKSNVDFPVTSKVVWRVNGTTKKTETVTIKPKTGYTAKYNFSVPAGTPNRKLFKVEVEVNPNRNQPADEIKWGNNKASNDVRAFVDEAPSGELGPSVIKK